MWGGGKCVGWLCVGGREVFRVEEDVWGGRKCVGWKRECVGWRKEGGEKCVGWRKEREDVGVRGWREEGEVCMYSDLSQLNPVRLGIQCCACGMD